MRSVDQFKRTKSALALAAVTVFVGVLLGGCHSDSGTTVAAPIVPSFSVGGNVTGLATGAQVTLLNNGGDSLTISADGKFAFPTLIADNGGYSVTVGTQPPDEHCSVAAGTGTNVQAAVTTVAVTCVTHNLYVGDTGAPKIYQYATGTGAISQLATPSVTTTGNIGNLILDNSRNYLYATIPSMNVVAQFNIGVDGSLTPMTTATVASGGTSPYEEALSPNGKWLFVGDQGNETVDSFAIGVDGSLTHVGTYSCTVSCNNTQGVVVDASSTHLYVAGATSGEIVMMTIGADGSLSSPVATSNGLGNAGELAISPSGAFLLSGASNTMEVFPISSVDGTLGSAVTNFQTTASAIYPLLFNGNYLYIGIGGSSSTVIDQFSWSDSTYATALSPATVASDPNPQRMVVDPTGTYMFVMTRTNKIIDQYLIGAGGVLTLDTSVVVLGATDTYNALAVK